MEGFIQEFKPSDRLLAELIGDRRKDVEALQRAEAERIKDSGERGRTRLKSLHDAVSAGVGSTLKSLDKSDAAEEQETRARVKRIKAGLTRFEIPAAAPAEHPGFV